MQSDRPAVKSALEFASHLRFAINVKVAHVATLFIFGLVAPAMASLAPPDFDLADGSGRAVFVHFASAQYTIAFDVPHSKTRVRSEIAFTTDKSGMPLFDLVDTPTTVSIDGGLAEQELIAAPGSTAAEPVQLRVVKRNVGPGVHRLVIEHEIAAYPPRYAEGAVNSGFFMSDFDPRGLLERYLPANLEFDQVDMTLNIEVIGATRDEIVLTNGSQNRLASNRWEIHFPNHFNCSALFFHLRASEETSALNYTYLSVDKRPLSVTIYKVAGNPDNLNEFRAVLDDQLSKLEQAFGPFPHPTITIFDSGLHGGGMEYSGAAFTDLESLPHELAHSYFGRGVMPANGNAGWIDEAMACLAGGGCGEPEPNLLKPSAMAAHSSYFRANDSMGYFVGVNFLAYLDHIFREKDPTLSLNGFLASWLAARLRTIVTTPILEFELERYSGMDLTNLFKKYVYGQQSARAGVQLVRHQLPADVLWQLQ